MIIRFKNFIISEELNDKEKEEVSKWPRDPQALEKTDHYFGKGNDEKSEELSGTVNKSEIHKKIEQHLGHQIDPADYHEGLTHDKYGRKIKIGGLLAKSKAPQELINSFANDNTRQGKKHTGLNVRITRSAAGVAGQTSHNQSWEQQSCKNFTDGSNKHYLPAEVKHGTVVGYLHNHKGEEIARTTLHPHTNDEGHTVYAVNSHYGIDHAGFKEHMEKVAKKLSGEYKGDSSGVYKIHPEVYNDTLSDYVLHPNATPEHITKALNDREFDVRKAAIQHPNATPEHITKALNDKSAFVRKAAIRHPKATPEHITKALNDDDDHEDVRQAAVSHPNATPEHIDKALNDKDEGVRQAAVSHPKATPEHIDKALNDREFDVRKAAIRHPKATPEHIDKALNDRSPNIRKAAVSHPNATSENINKALKDEYENVRQAAVSHPNATPEHIDKALNDREFDVRKAAIRHSKVTTESQLINLKNIKNIIKEALRS